MYNPNRQEGPQQVQRPEQRLTEHGEIAKEFQRFVNAGLSEQDAWKKVEQTFGKQAVQNYRKRGI